MWKTRDVVLIAAVAVVYVAAAKFGLLFALGTEQVTAVWPPTGLAFAAYARFGYRAWPGVCLGAFVTNATLDEPIVTAAGIGVGNALAGVAGLYLVRRIVGFQPALSRTRDVIALVVFAAFAGCAVSATSGVANLALGGVVPWSECGALWFEWWVGDAMGVVLFAPLVLTWWSPPEAVVTRARAVEFGALGIGAMVLCYVTFSGDVLPATAGLRVEYTIFPIVIWASLRFTLRESTVIGVVISAFAIWGAIHDRGPFAVGSLDQRLVLLELFMATTAVTALILGAVTAERRRAERAAEQARDQLELRVAERTADLAAANVELGKRNEEVEAFAYIVSHDLRAPLVNVQGFAKELGRSCQELDATLAAAALPDGTRASLRAILEVDIPESLRYIHAGTTKFQRLIDALLKLSRQGRQVYVSEALDVGALVTTTADALRQSIKTAGATVSIGELPAALGDPTALGQVFANLIANALAYAHPERAAHIEVGGELAPEGAVALAHYWVRDNGLGIPASVRPRVFQVFQRFHPDRAQGEGMGLAIVKRVVDRHGGRIWVDSEDGVGTTFHFTLPAPNLR